MYRLRVVTKHKRSQLVTIIKFSMRRTGGIVSKRLLVGACAKSEVKVHGASRCIVGFIRFAHAQIAATCTQSMDGGGAYELVALRDSLLRFYR